MSDTGDELVVSAKPGTNLNVPGGHWVCLFVGPRLVLKGKSKPTVCFSSIGPLGPATPKLSQAFGVPL